MTSRIVKEGGKTWYLIAADYVFGHSLIADATKSIEESGGEVLGQLITDQLLRAQATAVARARTAPTYVYEFAWPSPVRDLRAAHAIEIAFAFDRLDSEDAQRLSGPSAPQELATEMHDAWVRFIKTGDPGWERYDERRLTRVFDERTRTEPQRRTAVVDAFV